MSGFQQQQQNYKGYKETRKYGALKGEGKRQTETIPEKKQMMDLLDKDRWPVKKTMNKIEIPIKTWKT